jgi:Zn-dependent protease
MTASSVFRLSLTWQQYFARLALANLIVAVSNLFPFLPTDGYFILSTLFRQPNIRARAWREFKEVIRFRRPTSGLLMVYFAMSGLTILSLCILNIFRLYRLARFSIAGFICVCGLALLLVVRGRVLRRSHS